MNQLTTATIRSNVSEITTTINNVHVTPTMVTATKANGQITVSFMLRFPRIVQGWLGDDIYDQLCEGMNALKSKIRNESFETFEAAKLLFDIEEESYVAENHSCHVDRLAYIPVRAFARREDNEVVVCMTVTYGALRMGNNGSGTRNKAYRFVDSMRTKAHDQIGAAFDHAKELFKSRESNTPDPLTITVIGAVVVTSQAALPHTEMPMLSAPKARLALPAPANSNVETREVIDVDSLPGAAKDDTTPHTRRWWLLWIM
jgi:hypothetical protein